MTEAAPSPLEGVLRLVAAAAPQPWYPRLHAAATGYPLDRINYLLEHLWLDGLLQKGAGSPETGGGVLLSPAGAALLKDPEALRRLRAGEPIRPNDRGEVIRAVFRSQQKTPFTKLLIWLNILWFGWGLYLANRQQVAAEYLSGSLGGPNRPLTQAEIKKQNILNGIFHEIGEVTPEDLIRGQWWRLLSCCFVHGGLMHICFNMFGLHVIGRGAEQMWGRWRYLTIYLLSGLGGSCLALAYRPTPLVGASGAIYGILGAELMWLLLNGRYLPRHIVRRGWWGMGFNVLLLALFSSLPHVSALGHVGGMSVGASAALLLTIQRFGPVAWRWLAVLPLLAAPWLGIELIQRQRPVNPDWQRTEMRVYEHDYDRRFEEADRAFAEAMKPNTGQSAEKQLAAVLRALAVHEILARDLAGDGQFRSPEVLKERAEIRVGVEKRLSALKKKEAALRAQVEKEAG